MQVVGWPTRIQDDTGTVSQWHPFWGMVVKPFPCQKSHDGMDDHTPLLINPITSHYMYI